MKALQDLFEKNAAWAEKMLAADPDFFTNSAKGQSPEYLWIGCVDSRVTVEQMAGALPGDMLVHRNIANMVVHTDANSLSVVQFAVEALKVKHIVVCGHYGCGGVKASMQASDHGVMDIWLRHIQDVSRFHADALRDLNDTEKFDRLCELNVHEQVRNVCGHKSVQHAWQQGADLQVHGLIYDIHTGKLNDLGLSVSAADGLDNPYIQFDVS